MSECVMCGSPTSGNVCEACVDGTEKPSEFERVADFAASQQAQTIREMLVKEAPPCRYGSDEKHERGRILKEEYWDTPLERQTLPGGIRGVRAVLSSGGIGDYAVYLGAGTAAWVRDFGAKLTFEQAKGIFPHLDERRYRH